MSAFIVNKGHIDAMLRAGLTLPRIKPLYWYASEVTTLPEAQQWHRKLDHTTADRVGLMLVTENVASVRYRYRSDGVLPGPTDEYWQEVLDKGCYHYNLFGRMPTPVEALKLVNCYEYQSCEHPAWKTSEAHRFCEVLTHALVNALPGYEEATWEWEGA